MSKAIIGDNDQQVTASQEAMDMLGEIMKEEIPEEAAQEEETSEAVEETGTSDVEEEQETEEETEEEEVEIPEKFKGKDVKDIIKSYLELEKKFHQVSQEKNELYRKAFEKLVADEKKQDVDPQKQQEEEAKQLVATLKAAIPDDFVDSLIAEPEKAKEKLVEAISKISETIAEKKLETAIKPLMAKLVQQEVNSKLAKFKEKYPDYKDYEQQIIQVFERFPELDDGTVEGLEKAYLLARTLAGKPVVNKSAKQKNLKKKIAGYNESSGAKASMPKKATEEEDFAAQLLEVGKRLQGLY